MDEQIIENDPSFMLYDRRVARELRQGNRDVVNRISQDEWERLISIANVLHCENPKKIEAESG